MSIVPIYVLDANVFIEAKRRYYAFGICPGFWDCLVWHAREQRVCSIDRVKEELVEEGDDLSRWVTGTVPGYMFRETDTGDVAQFYAEANRWVQGQSQFRPAAKAEFAQEPDAWLIAYAKARGLVLVTHEALNEAIQRKVPIPNVCRALGVQWVDSFEMLDDLKARFTWQGPQ